jgi:transposase
VIPAALAVFVCTVAVDLRASFDRLAALTREHVGRDPLADGALYLFVNRAHTHAKVLWFQHGGWYLLYRRLERGTFRLPGVLDPDAKHVAVSRAELELLLEGIDLPRSPAPRGRRSPRPARPPPRE